MRPRLPRPVRSGLPIPLRLLLGLSGVFTLLYDWRVLRDGSLQVRRLSRYIIHRDNEPAAFWFFTFCSSSLPTGSFCRRSISLYNACSTSSGV